MLAIDRAATRRQDYLAATAVGMIFLLLGLGIPGFWEPWESGIVQLADFTRAHAWDPAIWWVPQTDNHLVYKPLPQIWSLVFVQSLFAEPSEFALRLPGALLGLGTLLLTFSTMRRFFARRTAWAVLVVLVSLPMFTFGARLLTGGIWSIAGVAIPLLCAIRAMHAESARARNVFGLGLGLGLGLAFLGGGIVAATTVVATLVAFLLWRRSAGLLRPFAAPGFIAGAVLSIAFVGYVFAQYLAWVPYALEDRAPLSAAEIKREVEAGHVESVGLRSGIVTGVLDDDAAERLGAERFVLSVDGTLRGSEMWEAWSTSPTEMVALISALDAAGHTDDGEFSTFDEPPSDEGATKATLRFFLYDLYDPVRLTEPTKARARSTVGAAPGLGIVHDEPESLEGFLLRLTDPLTGLDTERREAEAAREADGKKPPPAPANRVARPTQLRNGQEVTLVGPSDVPGWVEVEHANKTGYVPEFTLEEDPVLEHVTFDHWVRHVGFGLFPWVLLLPAALGVLLLRRTQGQSSNRSEGESVGDFMLVWLGMSVLALGIGASLFSYRPFTGVIPVGIATGLLLGSRGIWARVDNAPLLRKFIGFGAICILAVLIHDYKEHPWLFIETYLTEPEMEWEEGLQVLLTPFRLFRYIVAALFVAYFFGAVGWGNRVFARLSAFFEWRFGGWWAESWLRKAVRVPWRYGLRYPVLLAWAGAQTLRQVRVVFGVMAVSFAVLSTFVYLPAMSHHLTQKGLLERYDELSDEGEPLFNLVTEAQKSCRVYTECESGSTCIRGKCKPEATSFYLGDVDNIRETELLKEMEGDSRVFAVIPRPKLSRVNSLFRKTFPVGERENLAVLDTRSSRYLLVSNQLEDGEEDDNYIGDLILDGPPNPMFTPARPVRFTNGLEFLGYDLEPVEVASGDEFTVTYYFHITKDITADWQMFLHVDFPGTRINGDHRPGDGAFLTNTWIAGDYVKDIQKLEVDRGSPAGIYEMWFGFFSAGDNRLGVATGDHQDNRVRMGTMRVTGGL